MLDVAEPMNDLARDRPVFHSEADFQHSLAWCMHESIPNGEVRLEFKPFPSEPMYLDIWLPGIGVAVELKYPTRMLNLQHQGESFDVRDQRAQDTRRYDFLRDIERLERLRTLPNVRTGFAVLLTNDPTYWKRSSRPATVDEAFRLHEGRTKTGEMAWAESASAGTTKHREDPIRLNGSFELHWQDYADMEDGHHRQFRYLVVQTPYPD